MAIPQLRYHGKQVKVTLYRHYDSKDRLLYVGITGHKGLRFGQHSQGSDWWERVAYIKLEHFIYPEDAITAEQRAIMNEKPLFNRSLGGRSIGVRGTTTQD